MASYLKALRQRLVFDNNEQPERLKRIEELQQQLKKAGYHPNEVDYFVKSIIKSNDITKLNSSHLDEIIQGLDKQLQVSLKCKNIFKN